MKHWKTFSPLAVLLALPLSLSAAETLVSPVNIVSMSTGEIAINRAVLVEDGRISQILPADDPGLPEAASVIDGANGWLIPGLAEMHAHVPPLRRGERYARDIMSLFLANGVTTIRGMLGEPWHLALRDRLNEQGWPGPRLVTSGPSFNGNSVTSPQQAASMVKEQAEAGYDFLKLHPGLEPDEFEAIANTAREVGIPFAGHVSFAVGLKAALEAGQATIDHLDGYAEAMVPEGSEFTGVAPSWFGLNLASGMDSQITPSLAKMTALAKSSPWSGVWNVPTQSLFETTAGAMPVDELLARPGMDFVSDDQLGRWRESLESIRARSDAEQRRAFLGARRSLIKALQDADAGLLLGSDAPQIMNVPGFSVHQELEYMVGAGLSPLHALQSGTINVARFFRLGDSGEVAEGFVADFILLRSNPIDNIRATTEIEGVMRAGTWYDRAALDRMLEGVKSRGI